MRIIGNQGAPQVHDHKYQNRRKILARDKYASLFSLFVSGLDKKFWWAFSTLVLSFGGSEE